MNTTGRELATLLILKRWHFRCRDTSAYMPTGAPAVSLSGDIPNMASVAGRLGSRRLRFRSRSISSPRAEHETMQAYIFLLVDKWTSG